MEQQQQQQQQQRKFSAHCDIPDVQVFYRSEVRVLMTIRCELHFD